MLLRNSISAFATFILGALTYLPQANSATGVSAPGLLGSHNRVVVCYVSSWAAYRPGRGAFNLDDLDPQLCTHMVYAFSGLNITSGTLRSLDPYRDLEEEYGLGWYKKLTGLKQRFPHLKVTLAVGGWNEGSANYSKMAAEPELRKAFVESAVKILQKHGFDGLDLDWEFPGSRGGTPEDKMNFVKLVKELRLALAPRGLLVTAAFGASRSVIETAYDVAALGPLLDFMHVMCYDYHGSWDSKTSPNAPLNTKDSHDPLSVVSTIAYLKSLGAPAHKLVLGVPMYGRTFLLTDNSAENTRGVMPFGTSALSKGFQGNFTREDGFMGYNEICLELNGPNSNWKKSWDDVSKTPYAQDGNRWLTYDDERSVAEKAKFAVREGLGGVMVWSIDTDDFHGDCSLDSGIRKPYPIVEALNTAMTHAVDDMSYEKNHRPTHGHSDKGGNSGASITVTSSLFFAVAISVLLISN